MRYIEYSQIVEAVGKLCVEAGHYLPDDVLEAITTAAENESDPNAKQILDSIIENAKIAKEEMIPLCQDTGLTVVFVEQGVETAIKGRADNAATTLDDAINEGVRSGYESGYLRKSIVAEPLNERSNTGSNTPAVIHHKLVSGDKLKITVMAKGGGCENKSQFKMFKPTADKEDVVEWVVDVVKMAGADACPPFVVGVGIGGNFEYSCVLSKKALLRKLGDRNKEQFYAELERDILAKVNASGIGPQGMGGDTTALDCLIEFAPCHIASLPVAVNIECHSHRYKTVII